MYVDKKDGTYIQHHTNKIVKLSKTHRSSQPMFYLSKGVVDDHKHTILPHLYPLIQNEGWKIIFNTS